MACESIQSGLGLCRIAAAPIGGVLPHPRMGSQPGGCRAKRCWEQPGSHRFSAKAGSVPTGLGAHLPLRLCGQARGTDLLSQPVRGVSVTSSRKKGGRVEKDALGAFGISVQGLAVTGAAGKPCGGCCSGALHPTAAMLWDGRAAAGQGGPPNPILVGTCLGFTHLQGAFMLGTCREDHRPNPASFGQVHPKDAQCCGWAVPAQPQTTPHPVARPRWCWAPFIPHRCCLSQGLAEQKTCSVSRSERRQSVV